MAHHSEEIMEYSLDIASELAGEAAAALDGSDEAREKLQDDLQSLSMHSFASKPVAKSLDMMVNQSGLLKPILAEVNFEQEPNGSLKSIEFVNENSDTSLTCSEATNWVCTIKTGNNVADGKPDTGQYKGPFSLDQASNPNY